MFERWEAERPDYKKSEEKAEKEENSETLLNKKLMAEFDSLIPDNNERGQAQYLEKEDYRFDVSIHRDKVRDKKIIKVFPHYPVEEPEKDIVVTPAGNFPAMFLNSDGALTMVHRNYKFDETGKGEVIFLFTISQMLSVEDNEGEIKAGIVLPSEIKSGGSLSGKITTGDYEQLQSYLHEISSGNMQLEQSQ